MREPGTWIFLVILVAIVLLITFFVQREELRALRAQIKMGIDLAAFERDLKNREAQHSQLVTRETGELKEARAIVLQLANEKSKGFPWLAEAYAEFWMLQDFKRAHTLESKRPPARVAAEEVREIAREKRRLWQELRLTKYKIAYYENLFPWLIELSDLDLDEVKRRADSSHHEIAGDDPAATWLSADEYKALSSVERNQRAFERYRKRNKSSWEIGREYERYVGYKHEAVGFEVTYHGIIKGYEDLGRDIIAKKGDDTLIIQCKNWSKDKQIHEKHIFQLFGSAVEYAISAKLLNKQKDMFEGLLRGTRVRPVFYTSTKLSEKAMAFATALGIEINQSIALGDYPMIKCNVGHRGDERIYHLPFDQQYDSTTIDTRRGEFYAATVAEAEKRGFRRAWRWHPAK